MVAVDVHRLAAQLIGAKKNDDAGHPPDDFAVLTRMIHKHEKWESR
jgi:hypothetical protein